MTKIYHNPRCTKSRQTLALLEEHGIDADVVRYLDQPPSEAELTEIIRLLGIEPKQLVRTKEKLFAELGLKGAELSEAQWIKTLADHPKLIERPIVVHGNRAAIGRPPENVLEILR
ncbi:arsenate reductase (glutaredoxin) [Roseimaritima sediminicola]|uniref:arsenate reductase (glutaredoxin) n=1 Tax=Roseimaritima sediminicola TaxID=2662066 RepID=UPI0012984185|nr:arsenate reductase (glutaredoxin) [Roseimaritima sediminicola]